MEGSGSVQITTDPDQIFETQNHTVRIRNRKIAWQKIICNNYKKKQLGYRNW